MSYPSQNEVTPINAKEAMSIAQDVASLASIYLLVGRISQASEANYIAQIQLLDKHKTVVHVNSGLLLQPLKLRAEELMNRLVDKGINCSDLVEELETQLQKEAASGY